MDDVMTGGVCGTADDPADEAGFRSDQAGALIPHALVAVYNARSTPHRQPALDARACVHPNAAGLDIGSEAMVVAVPPDRDSQPVRVFLPFTTDLHALVAWLLTCGIDTVAMESTGVFWIPISDLLEATGIVP